jgi:phospholipid/cholesterol/gamma-HCH transport system ATP-binding protein
MDLATRELTLRFGPLEALSGVSCALPSGSRVFLGGAAGSGKTLLLKALAGLAETWTGEVLWDGAPLSTLPVAARKHGQARFGMVFQTDALFDSMNVLDNVLLPLRRREVPAAEATRRAKEALEALGIAHAAASRPEQLSGGMRKRAGLARAIVARPEILFCDDPLAGLDPHTGRQVCELLSRVAEGRTLVCAAPEPPEVAGLDRWLWLDAGKLVHDGAARPDLLEPAHLQLGDPR